MSVHKLSCPSCGASIELPAQLTRGHCVYCGSDVVVETDPRRVKIDRADELAKSTRLLETALEARNLPDVVRYADRVLEVDPDSSYAWYSKGWATCNLSTWQADRWEEGRTYLGQALQLDPNNTDAAAARDNWPLTYCQYLYGLSEQQWNVAYGVWQAECLASFGSIAERKAAPYAAVAIAAVDKALGLLGQVRPGFNRDQWESALLLKKVGYLNSLVTGEQFGRPEPYLQRAHELKAKWAIWADVSALPRLLDELTRTEAEISRIEQGGGFFARRKLDDLGKQRDGYTERIMRAEELRDAEGTPQGQGAT